MTYKNKLFMIFHMALFNHILFTQRMSDDKYTPICSCRQISRACDDLTLCAGPTKPRKAAI